MWARTTKKRRLPPLEYRPIEWLVEEGAAARICQRWIRGTTYRKRLLNKQINNAGLVATRAVIRLQKVWRGRKGRIHVGGVLRTREAKAASTMSALCRGRAGRLRARFFRVQEAETAAKYIQLIYRGRLGKKIYDLYLQDERRKRAQAIQSSWRGRCGRIYSEKRKHALHSIENWLDKFRQVSKRAKAFRLERRCQNMKLDENNQVQFWLWQALDSSTRAAEIFEPFLMSSHKNYLCSRRQQEKEAILKAVIGFLFAADDFRDYSYATELLFILRQRFPNDIIVLYASAIAQHLSWSCYGSLRARRPEPLEDALNLARKAWALDTSRQIINTEWSIYLMAARRQRKPGSLCAAAVATQAVDGRLYGDILGILSDHIPCATQVRRWQRSVLKTRAIHLRAQTVADAFVQREHVLICSRVFEDLYAVRPLLLPETRLVRIGRSLQGDENYATSSNHNMQNWQLNLYKAGDLLVCSAFLRRNRSIRAREYIIHQSEISWLQETTGICNALLTELILRQLVVTRRGIKQEQLALPGLERARARRNELEAERIGAERLRRAFRGFDQRAFFRRLAFRVRQKDIQAASLAIRRAQTLLEKLHRVQLMRRAQAVLRGRAIRKYNAVLRSAVLFLQRHFRSVLARARVAAEAKRRLEGAQLDILLTQGRIVSGRRLLIRVAHCGLNFKFVGHDLQLRKTYIGFVYQPSVMRILHHVNLALTSPLAQLSGIRPNQHVQIAQLLLDRLAIVDTPFVPTAELKLGTSCALVLIDHERADDNIKLLAAEHHDKRHYFAHPPERREDDDTAVGLLQKRGLHRYLSDTEPALHHHFKLISDHRSQLRDRGIVPVDPCPSDQDRAIAAAKFKMRVYGGGQPQQDEARRLLDRQRRRSWAFHARKHGKQRNVVRHL